MHIRAYPTHYNIDGKKYNRVTSVLDYFLPKPLLEWALKEGRKEYKNKTKTAKSIGKRVDKIATAIVNKQHWKVTDKDHPAVRNCVRGFQNWLNEEKPDILDTQVTCYDEKLGIAGTRDLRTYDTIIDIKCANRISLSYWLQLAAYVKLSKLPITHIAVLRLDKLTGDNQYKRIPYDEILWLMFLNLLSYYRYATIYNKKGGEENHEVKAISTEFEKKFGIFASTELTDWDKFKSEI